MLPFQTPKTLFDHFLGLANEYGWECLVSRIATADEKNSSDGMEQISLMNPKIQVWGYFGLKVIVNQNKEIPDLLSTQALSSIAKKSAREKLLW